MASQRPLPILASLPPSTLAFHSTPSPPTPIPPTRIRLIVLGQPLCQRALQPLPARSIDDLIIACIAAVARGKVAEDERLGVLGAVVVVNV